MSSREVCVHGREIKDSGDCARPDELSHAEGLELVERELARLREENATLRAERDELEQYQLDCKCADFAAENDELRERCERCEALEGERRNQLNGLGEVSGHISAGECADCGAALNAGEAATFTVCDACWELNQ